MEESVKSAERSDACGGDGTAEASRTAETGGEAEASQAEEMSGEAEASRTAETGGEAETFQAEEAAGMLQGIRAMFQDKPKDIRTYSPLTLAYIGDAVYELVIRTVVVDRANRPANTLHHITVRYVSAEAQAKFAEALLDTLTEEELAVYRRGKNSKPHTTAKNATVAEYMKATGFEAVIGYLYLTGRTDRMLTLIKEGIRAAGMTI